MNTFAHHTFLFLFVKKEKRKKKKHVSISFHFTVLHHFVLVYHIKSQKNTFTFVVKTWQNVENFKGVNTFARHCLYIYRYKCTYMCTYVSLFKWSPAVLRLVPPDVTYMLYTCQYSCLRVVRLVRRLVCVVQHITDIVTSRNTCDTICE